MASEISSYLSFTHLMRRGGHIQELGTLSTPQTLLGTASCTFIVLFFITASRSTLPSSREVWTLLVGHLSVSEPLLKGWSPDEHKGAVFFLILTPLWRYLCSKSPFIFFVRPGLGVDRVTIKKKREMLSWMADQFVDEIASTSRGHRSLFGVSSECR